MPWDGGDTSTSALSCILWSVKMATKPKRKETAAYCLRRSSSAATGSLRQARACRLQRLTAAVRAKSSPSVAAVSKSRLRFQHGLVGLHPYLGNENVHGQAGSNVDGPAFLLLCLAFGEGRREGLVCLSLSRIEIAGRFALSTAHTPSNRAGLTNCSLPPLWTAWCRLSAVWGTASRRQHKEGDREVRRLHKRNPRLTTIQRKHQEG